MLQPRRSASTVPLSFPTFWSRFTLRHARQEWGQTLLLLLILGLGVGTFISIRMANRAAVEGFQLFTDSLTGTSDWVVEGPLTGLPIDRLPDIRQALDPLPARLFPVVERSVNRLPAPGTPLGPAEPPVRLLGLDLLQVQSAAGLDEEAGNKGFDDFWAMVDDPSHLMVTPAVARRWQVETGDSVELVVQGRPLRFTVHGLLPEFQNGLPVPQNLALADVSGLMARLGLQAVDRVEVILPGGEGRAGLVGEAGIRLRAAFGEEWAISSPLDERVEGASMTAAFRLNLSVLSLIALLVGLTLIAQTLDATVSRRRREIATLRSLGIGPRDIFRLWLSEAVFYGVLAGALGLVTGLALSHLTIEAVTTTVRALYRDTVQGASGLTTGDVVLSFALGMGGSLLAAWLPARDAASTPPAQFLRLGKRIPPFPLFQHPWLGLGALLVGGLLLWLPPWPVRGGGQIPVAGYLTAFLWLTGGTLVAVAALQGTGHALHALARNQAGARLAGSRLRQPTSRHQLALSGFFVAIGMAAAMAFLIRSFEHTVTGWLEHRLRADLFISSIGFQGSEADQLMEGTLLDQITSHPQVAAMDRYRSVDLLLGESRASLAGVRFALLGNEQDLLWIAEPLPADSRPRTAEATGYANENLLRRAGLALGEVVEVPTPAGPRRVWIGGVHADYASENGLLLIDLPLLESWFGVTAYETASLFLQPGADPAIVQAQLRAEHPGLAIRQNGELKEAALYIFNQTFAVTHALQAIGLIVALAGLALSLLSLLRESGRELALQRTLGMSRHEIAMTTAWEGMGIAVTGLASGLLLSVALGQVLIFVINRQSFGWTLQVAYPWTDVLVLGTAVVTLGFAIAYGTGRLYLRQWRQEPS